MATATVTLKPAPIDKIILELSPEEKFAQEAKGV